MDSGLQLGTKIFLCPIRDKNSNELQNCFVKCSIPGLLSPVFKTFAAVFPDPTDRPWVSDDGSPQDTRDGVDLYIAQASFAWPALIWPDHFVEAVSAIFVFFSSSLVKSA